MALIECPECRKEISDKSASCINCGCPIDSAVQKSTTTKVASKSIARPKKPIYKRVWFWIVCIVVLFVIIGSLGDSDVDSPSQPTTSVSDNSDSDEHDDEYIRNVLQYHKNKVEGTASDAELSGSFSAMKLNLSLYKSNDGADSLKYRSYFYALYGEQAYLDEFDKDYLYDEVKDYLTNLDTEGILERAFIAYENEAEAENMQSIADRDEYISSATTVSYDKLIREPYNYEGEIISVSINISQVMAGGILTESGYRGYENGVSNEWYISYSLPENSPRIIEGDRVTFYGEFDGLAKMKRALTGTTDEVPRLVAMYHD